MNKTPSPLAILLVGHSHWGKSRTLRAFTEGTQRRYESIGERTFFVRRMSNDDYSDKYGEFVEGLEPETDCSVILAFCPDFSDPGKGSEDALKILANGYTISSFVLRHAFGDARMITDAEIETLRRYGRVSIFERKGEEAEVRAQAFRAHITGLV